MKVVIDNVVYVPNTTIEHADQPAVQQAIRSIVQCMYLHGPHARGTNGGLYDALKALAPNLVELLDETDIDAVCDALPGFHED